MLFECCCFTLIKEKKIENLIDKRRKKEKNTTSFLSFFLLFCPSSEKRKKRRRRNKPTNKRTYQPTHMPLKLAWINHTGDHHRARNVLFFSLFLLLLLTLVWSLWTWRTQEPFITSAKVAPELESYFYKGCWAENPENRGLKNYLGQGTAEDCVRLAVAKNFDTVALTDGNHCWGGNHGQFDNNYQKYGQLNDLIGCDFVAPENDAMLVYSKSVLGNIYEAQTQKDNQQESQKEKENKKTRNLTSNYTYNFYDMPSAEELDDRAYPSDTPDMIVDAHKHMEAWKPPYPAYPFPPPEMNAEDAIMMRGYADIPSDLDYTQNESFQESFATLTKEEKKKNVASPLPIEIDVSSSSYIPPAPPLNPNAGSMISRADARKLYLGKPQDYLLRSNVSTVGQCSVCGGGGGRGAATLTKEKKKKKCPACPACPRCPEPEYECKQIPSYSNISYDNIPGPSLSTFKSFGM